MTSKISSSKDKMKGIFFLNQNLYFFKRPNSTKCPGRFNEIIQSEISLLKIAAIIIRCSLAIVKRETSGKGK